MLQLHSYLNKLYEIKWYFDEKDLSDLQTLLFVRFERNEDHFKIKSVQYTYADILLGLEGMNFELNKNNNEVKIKILKI